MGISFDPCFSMGKTDDQKAHAEGSYRRNGFRHFSSNSYRNYSIPKVVKYVIASLIFDNES